LSKIYSERGENDMGTNNKVIDEIKCYITRDLSKLDFDSLLELEALIRAEKETRPEVVLF
jgi:hypothetical protein